MFPSSFVPITTSITPTGDSGSLAPPTSIYSLHHKATKSTTVKKVLLLLHGYPQNHVLWYKVIQELEETYPSILEEFDIVIPDLPSYGKSTKSPSPDGSHFAHSKRAVAGDIINLMDQLVGVETKFVVVGHDRGARVAYKLTKDNRSRVLGLCVQDIVPTRYMFEAMNISNKHKETRGSYHWIFLSLPSPLPETLIGNDPNFYFTHTMNSWTGSKLKGKLDPQAMDSWVSQYSSSENILGSLEDYRAGASIDLDQDKEDEDNDNSTIGCELLVLYSVHLENRFDVAKIWEGLAEEGGKKLRSVKIGDEGTGHFLPIEAEEQTTKEMVEFLERIKFE